MPAARLKVSLEMPAFDQGEMAENPIPAPKASSNSVNAAVVTPPAAMAAQDTADWFSSRAPTRVSVLRLLVMVMAMVSMLRATSQQHSDGVNSSGSVPCARANSASDKAWRWRRLDLPHRLQRLRTRVGVDAL